MTKHADEKALVALAVGFGCLIGFARLCASGFSGLAGEGSVLSASWWYALRTASELVVLLLLAAAGWRRWFSLGPGVLIVAAICAGAAAVASSFALPEPALAAVAALAGASTAALMYAWVLLLARWDVASIVVSTLLGLMFAGLIVEGAPLLGSDLAFDAVAVAAVAAGAIAVALDPRLECCRADGPLREVDALSVPWPTVALVVACGFMSAVLYGVAGSSVLPRGWEPDVIAFDIAVVAVVLATVAVMMRSRAWAHIAWVPLFALFAIALVMSCSPAREVVQVAVGLLVASVFCASFLAWVVFPALLSTLPVPRAFLAGVLLACSSNSLAMLAGGALGEALPASMRDLASISGVFAVIVAALLALGFIANRNRIGMVGMRPVDEPEELSASGEAPEALEEEAGANPLDALKERLGVYSARYGLTPRESEVALYTVQGFSCAYIADKLVVSNSTVRFHQRNIYRKLDVHSRNELIEFVNEGEKPDSES